MKRIMTLYIPFRQYDNSRLGDDSEVYDMEVSINDYIFNILDQTRDE